MLGFKPVKKYSAILLYGHPYIMNNFVRPDKMLTFSLKLTCLMWTPVNMDQRPKSQTLIMVNLALWMQVFCALSVTDMIEYCTTGSPGSI